MSISQYRWSKSRRNCFLISALRVLIAASTALRTAPALMNCLLTTSCPGRAASARLIGTANKVKPSLPCAVSTPLWCQHSAVVSAINNLEHRGLDRIRSKGICPNGCFGRRCPERASPRTCVASASAGTISSRSLRQAKTADFCNPPIAGTKGYSQR